MSVPSAKKPATHLLSDVITNIVQDVGERCFTMNRLEQRLTDPVVAENLRSNAESLQKAGIAPTIDTLRYIKLSAYEDQEADQTICPECQHYKPVKKGK